MERQDGKIIERNIETEMKTAYIDYAMSVIVMRLAEDAKLISFDVAAKAELPEENTKEVTVEE